MARDMNFNLRIAGDQANKTLKEAAKNAEAAGDELEDLGSAGQRLAALMKQSADQVERELDQVTAAAEVLEAALGDETAAAAREAGFSIEQMVMELRQAGLTFEDIEQDAEDLADAIRHVDQVGSRLDGVKRGAREVADEFDHVSRRTDNTRSVVANFAGNSVQELPGVASALGPLNMAMGQFAEYASEGNIGMRNFLKAGAGLGVAAGAMWALSRGAEQAARRTEDLEEWTRKLLTATDEVVLAGWNKWFMQSALDSKNLKDSVEELATTNIEGARRLLDVSLAAGATSEEMRILRDAIRDAEEAAARGEENQRKYGDALAETNPLLDTAARLLAGVKSGTDAVITAALDEHLDEIATAAFGATSSFETLKKKYEGLLGLLDRRQAIRNAEAAIEDLQAAAEEAFTAQATGAEDAESKMRAYEQSIDDMLAALINAQAPPDIVANVTAELEAGKLNEARFIAQTWLNNHPVDLPVRPKITNISNARGTNLRVDENGNVRLPGFDQGGIVPGPIGAPQLAVVHGGEEVLTPEQRRASGGAATYNVTVNHYGPGELVPDAVVDALAKFDRRNGTRIVS
ncbi:MAG TPA: hypothetical protein VGK49_04475 [Ilumatobacteraceae bacterium]